MSALFGSVPKMQSVTPSNVQAGSVETDAANAGMFERLRRAQAYGKQKTMLAGKLSPAVLERKTLLGIT